MPRLHSVNTNSAAKYAAAIALTTFGASASAQQTVLLDQSGAVPGERYGAALDMTRPFLGASFSDGIESLIVGAPTDGTLPTSGRVDVLTLNTTSTPQQFNTVSYAVPTTAPPGTALFGSSMDFLRTDVIGVAGTVGAPAGTAAMGLGHTFDLRAGTTSPIYIGATPGDLFGSSIALVQNLNTSQAYRVTGVPQPNGGNGQIRREGNQLLYQGAQPGALFGASIESVVDIDGDGIEEFIVGAPGEGAGGAAYVFSGNSLRIGFPVILNVVQGSAAEQLGARVGNAGDVDGDGAGDYWVCCPNFGINEGRILVYSGATHSVIRDMRGTTAVGAAGGKDVDGDGTPDFLISSRSVSNLATVRSGVDGSLIATIQRDGLDDGSPVTALSMGDVNGDRRSEVVIGQGLYSTATQSEVGRVQLVEVVRNVGLQYCYSGTLTGAGEFSTLRGTGTGSLLANDLTLDVLGLMPGSLALFFAADGAGMAVPAAGTLGTICIGGAIGRYNGQVATADASGRIAFPISLSSLPTPSGTPVAAMIGSSWFFQALHSDVLPSGLPVRHFTPGLGVVVQ